MPSPRRASPSTPDAEPAGAQPPRSGYRWSQSDPSGLSAASLAAVEPSVAALDPRIAAVLERCFLRLSGRDSSIDARALGSALEIKHEYLAQRVLSVLDADRDGLIDREDFLGSVRTLLFGDAHARLAFAFRIHDLDEDGALSRDELQRMIALGLSEDALEISALESARLSEIVLAGADLDHDQRISLPEFETAVRKHARVLEQITESGLIWLAPDDGLRADVAASATGSRSAGFGDRMQLSAIELARKLENRAGSIVLFSCWALLNAVLFERAMFVYAARGAPLSLQIARGAGACLKLDCALLLIPVLRLALTWVRRARFLRALPVDAALDFHRILGGAVFGFALLHSAAHLAHLDPQFDRELGPLIAGMPAGPSGTALLGCLSVVWLCALPLVRGRNFELFHFSHLLYLAFFALLFVHAKSFWLWGTLPCLAFAFDRGLRIVRRTQKSHVVTARALRSEVTRLELARPFGFAYQASDYVFIRIPEVAPHEWHPFTISSAPERDLLSLHIRKLGDWTGRLHALIASGRAPEPPALEVELDGPYGAPSARIFESRYVVLIGAGIGATPFASVLESVALRVHEQAARLPLEKLHFFWINRDQRGFEWFRDLLATIERMDSARYLDIRIHMTGGRNDAAAAIVSLARELAHAQGRPDLVTGLKARTHMGDPDFVAELSAIAQQHAPEKIVVFFCGPRGLARKVKAVCLQLDLEFHAEPF